MIKRTAMVAISAIAFALASFLFASTVHASGTKVERRCENGVCGQSEYNDGKVRITVSSELSRTTHFNFKTNPGAQIEIRGSYSFDWAPGGAGTYSVQACDRGGFGSRSTCTRWATFDWTSGPDPAKEAAAQEENARIESDRSISGKGPTDCARSRERCFARCQGRGPVQEAVCQSQECMPIFNACMANAGQREAEFQADRQVTGKSLAECQASRGRCINRCQARGPYNAPVCISQECEPVFAQCASNSNRNRGGGPVPAHIAVVQSVDMYSEKYGEGEKTGILHQGTTGVTLVEPCDDNWCHVKFRTGQGWVYNGDDYKSLDIP